MVLSLTFVFVLLIALVLQSSGGPDTTLLDYSYIVSVHDFRPHGDIHAFEPESVLNKYLVQSREVFPSQSFYGSVILGGANVVIPKGWVWRDSKLTRVTVDTTD